MRQRPRIRPSVGTLLDDAGRLRPSVRTAIEAVRDSGGPELAVDGLAFARGLGLSPLLGFLDRLCYERAAGRKADLPDFADKYPPFSMS